MGSFLNSCAITNSSIAEGALVFITPVVKNAGYHPCSFKEKEEVALQEYNSPCYASAFWRPLGVGIIAEVDDCGRTTPVDDKFNRVSLLILYRELARKTLTTLEGENTVHDLPCDIKGEWSKSALSTIKDFPKEIYKLSFKEFLKLWEYIQEREVKNRIFVYDHTFRKIIPFKFSTCLYQAFEHVCNLNKHDFIEDNFNDKKSSLEHFKGDQRMIDHIKSSAKYEVLRPRSGKEISCVYTEYLYTQYTNVDIFKKNEREKLKKNISQITQFWAFQYNLSNAGLIFQINKYAGQDYENSIGKNTQKIITKINKEYNKWLKEKYED